MCRKDPHGTVVGAFEAVACDVSRACLEGLWRPCPHARQCRFVFRENFLWRFEASSVRAVLELVRRGLPCRICSPSMLSMSLLARALSIRGPDDVNGLPRRENDQCIVGAVQYEQDKREYQDVIHLKQKSSKYDDRW